MNRLLIVDDEPNLAEGLSDYLTQRLPSDTDILRAFSGQEAINLLNRFPIDLVISDIQMPGMNGLELLTEIERMHLLSRVIFLTGYDTFEWVQQALRHPYCVDYILKSQGACVVEEAVMKQLSKANAQNAPEAIYKTVSNEREILKPLLRKQAFAEWITGNAGPFPALCEKEERNQGYMCLYSREEGGKLDKMFLSVLESLHESEFGGAEIDVAFIGWREYACLFRFDKAEEGVHPVSLRSRYERVLSRLRDLGENVNCAFLSDMLHVDEIGDVLFRLRKSLTEAEASGKELLIDVGVSGKSEPVEEKGIHKWIKQYIQDNIADPNLSLTVVAEKTFYTPSYLSRMFKQHEGVNFMNYVNRVRIEMACELLKQGNKNVKDVTRMVGFESPSYFSAFFKRHVGVNPVQFMRDLSKV